VPRAQHDTEDREGVVVRICDVHKECFDQNVEAMTNVELDGLETFDVCDQCLQDIRQFIVARQEWVQAAMTKPKQASGTRQRRHS
jgi:hypothetical protein